MTRQCERCGKGFDAKRPDARFCGTTCQKAAKRAEQRAVRAGVAPPAPVQPRPAPVAVVAPQGGDVTSAVLARLEEAGKVDDPQGRLALALAARVDLASLADTGSALAAVSKELRAVMAEVTAGVPEAADGIDELRARRLARRGA